MTCRAGRWPRGTPDSVRWRSRILVERLEILLVFRVGGVLSVLERRVYDQLIHQRVRHARDLHKTPFLGGRLTGGMQNFDLLPVILGVHPDDRVGRGRGWLAIAGNAGDRDLDRDGADVRPAEAV